MGLNTLPFYITHSNQNIDKKKSKETNKKEGKHNNNKDVGVFSFTLFLLCLAFRGAIKGGLVGDEATLASSFSSNFDSLCSLEEHRASSANSNIRKLNTKKAFIVFELLSFVFFFVSAGLERNI